jgi:hypothetical protein
MNYFVFVVCGGKEYINELNFSLKFLRHFSNYPILVLTDKTRNEIEIEHDNIIDARTPEKYANHQAHLFLETRLPHYVNPQDDDLFCYLDSDVIAIDPGINNIFEEFIPPVRFAPDHCTIDYFSAGVMNCNCRAEFELVEKQFHFMQSYYPEYDKSDKEVCSDHEQLKKMFDKIKRNPFSDKLSGLHYFWKRYFLKTAKINLKDKFFFDKETKCWYNNSGQLIDYDHRYFTNQLWEKHNIRYRNNRWENSNGKALIPKSPHCSHLRDYICKQYKIPISAGWRHWNGGVFLFGKESVNFMNLWHRFTMQEFDKGEIKTYDDQGTLAVCAWHFGIQDMKPLSIKYNFITDFGNENVKYDKISGYTYNNFKTIFKPVFLHVYNQWDNENWNIWQSVIEIGKRHKII